MKITVSTAEGAVFPLDINDELPLGDLKALLEVEVGIPVKEIMIIHNMIPLNHDDQSLKSLGVNDGDMLLSIKLSQDTESSEQSIEPPQLGSQPQSIPHSQSAAIPDIDWSGIQVPSSLLSRQPVSTDGRPSVPPQQLVAAPSSQDQQRQTVEEFAQHFLANPGELAAMQQRHPEVAEAILSGDYNWMLQAITHYRQKIVEEERQRAELAGLDPWSEEYQQKLAENIRRRNIQENMETALEHNPEIFMGRVHMLYILCRVNGQPVKALVDTGAQMTVMNVQCAQRCDIMRLVDRRYASYAFGVGRQRIIGVIHLGQIQIGEDFLASSFRVLEDQSHELILGLDMLKRHQCCVDLSRDVLRIGTTSKETKFLLETDVPKATYEIEEKGILEDEDHEMASAIAKSEADYKKTTGEDPPPSPHPLSSPLPPSSVVPPTPQVDNVTVSDDSLREVMSAGFDRETAVEELVKCNNDPVKAKANLFAKVFSF